MLIKGFYNIEAIVVVALCTQFSRCAKSKQNLKKKTRLITTGCELQLSDAKRASIAKYDERANERNEN